MNESTFVVWNNTKHGYLESIGRGGVYYTGDLDSAFQFTKKKEAEYAMEACDDDFCVILKWI